MRWLWPVVALVACDGQTTTDDTAETGDSGDTAEVDPDLATLSGQVVQADGTPMADVEVNLCQMICRTVHTDASGAFELQAEPGNHSLHVRPDSDALPEPLVPLTFTAQQQRSVTVKVPALGSPVALSADAAELEVLPGFLWLTTSTAASIPLSTTEVTSVAAARLDPADLPAWDGSGTVVGALYLSPYQAREDGGTALRLANDLGLAAGDTVRVFTANYASFSWVDGGTLSVDGEGAFLTGDAKLGEWTTVVFVVE